MEREESREKELHVTLGLLKPTFLRCVQLFAWSNLTLPKPIEPHGSLCLHLPSWRLSLPKKWGHRDGTWEERSHHSSKAWIYYYVVQYI